MPTQPNPDLMDPRIAQVICTLLAETRLPAETAARAAHKIVQDLEAQQQKLQGRED